MEQNSASLNPLLEQFQKECALQLASFQFQMMQRTMAFNRMMPVMPPFNLSMFPGLGMMNQFYSLPHQGMFPMGSDFKPPNPYFPPSLSEITQQS